MPDSFMLTVYVYQNCSTCRDALKWLDRSGINYVTRPIRESPPTPAELKKALTAYGNDLRKIFNTSGVDYRSLGLKDRLPTMNEIEAIDILSKNGNLVKRPFAISEKNVLVGFKEPIWEDFFVSKNK